MGRVLQQFLVDDEEFGMTTQDLIQEEISDDESSITEEEYLAKTRQPSLYPDEPVSIEFHGGKLWATLADGRTIGTPLAWYPFLMKATPHQREITRLEPRGIWWMELDEGLSIIGMLEGRQGTPKQLEAMWADTLAGMKSEHTDNDESDDSTAS
jgi:hypothetical protein